MFFGAVFTAGWRLLRASMPLQALASSSSVVRFSAAKPSSKCSRLEFASFSRSTFAFGFLISVGEQLLLLLEFLGEFADQFLVLFEEFLGRLDVLRGQRELAANIVEGDDLSVSYL